MSNKFGFIYRTNNSSWFCRDNVLLLLLLLLLLFLSKMLDVENKNHSGNLLIL